MDAHHNDEHGRRIPASPHFPHIYGCRLGKLGDLPLLLGTKLCGREVNLAKLDDIRGRRASFGRTMDNAILDEEDVVLSADMPH